MSLRLLQLLFASLMSLTCLIGSSIAQQNKTLRLESETLRLPPALNSPSSLSLSGDGKLAALITSGGDVILWQTSTGKILETIAVRSSEKQVKGKPSASSTQAPQSLPSAIALNHDGSLLAIGYLNASLQLRSRIEQATIREFEGHSAEISALRFSSSGELLASGAKDGTTQVWRVDTGKRLHIFDSMYYGDISRAAGLPVGLAFYADDHRLIVNEWFRGHYDVGRLASVWDLDTGYEVERFSIAPPNNSDQPRSGMAVNQQSWQLIFTGDWIKEKNGLMLKRLDTCNPERQLSMGGYADTVAIDPKARWFAAVDSNNLMLFEAQVPHRVVSYPSLGTVIALHVEATGNSMIALVLPDKNKAVLHRTSEINVYGDSYGGAELYRIKIPKNFLAQNPSLPASDLSPCPISDKSKQEQKFTIPVPTQKLQQLATLSAPMEMLVSNKDFDVATHPSAVAELFFTSDDNLLARHRGSYDSTHYMRSGIASWDLNNVQLIRANFNQTFDETGLLRGPATWYQAHETVLDLLSEQALKAINNRAHPESYLYPTMSIDPQTGYFFKFNTQQVEVYNEHGQRIESKQFKGKILAIAARNGRLAVLHDKNQVLVWSYLLKQSKNYRLALKLEDYDSVEELRLSANGDFLKLALPSPSGDAPTEHIVYHLARGKVVGRGEFLTDFPLHGNRVVVADVRQHRLAVWDFDQAKILARLPRQLNRNQENEAVPLLAAISEQAHLVASASLNGLLRIWDIQERKLIGEIKLAGVPSALAFSPSANKVAVGKADGSIAIIGLPPAVQKHP